MPTDRPSPPISSPAARFSQPPPRDWTWRHAVAGIFICADLLYIAFIISGIVWSGERILYPPQLSQIIVGALSAGTALSISLIVIARIATRVEDAVVIIGVLAAKAQGEARDPTVGLDDPTVPIGHRIPIRSNGHTVYTSAYATQSEALADAVAAKVVARIDSQLEDLGILAANEQSIRGRANGGIARFPQART